MKVLVGLGNPGKEYEKNRHNAGFIILDKLAQEKGLEWVADTKCKIEVAKDSEFVLIKPQTFMNLSGTAVVCYLNYFKLEIKDILVIHDDVDLPFGRVKKQLGGSSAGHHGIEDMIQKLGTGDFWRLRIGVGRPENLEFEVSEWVLSDFDESELKQLKETDYNL
jgi:peptidyl-tRNA hydrolase, PTH1 family